MGVPDHIVELVKSLYECNSMLVKNLVPFEQKEKETRMHNVSPAL